MKRPQKDTFYSTIRNFIEITQMFKDISYIFVWPFPARRNILQNLYISVAAVAIFVIFIISVIVVVANFIIICLTIIRMRFSRQLSPRNLYEIGLIWICINIMLINEHSK